MWVNFFHLFRNFFEKSSNYGIIVQIMQQYTPHYYDTFQDCINTVQNNKSVEKILEFDRLDQYFTPNISTYYQSSLRSYTDQIQSLQNCSPINREKSA
ncbi:hypothetical protein [Rickettsiales endosymbiont of Stachyamoeba lipophora]|uniref:hypothetical protein n=1 Tax=Rickettsiales endosymbiont of Stachyamoeba lipophora TaxID=2486578 RepID=UPI000F64DDBB|nr:hypothetical protein [Rickettsiales endosymbiont of Stachyamoeba lipophora]AZL16000.1 hypothetical protein EF513_05550 [Rickettsiales endosymbiont of Stachyamoeba lipophora]